MNNTPPDVTNRMSELWMQIGPLFRDPDGDLPEISIGDLTARQVSLVARLLQSHAAAANAGVTWTPGADDVLEVAVPVADLEAAASEVASGQRDPFHVVLTEVAREATKIPDLGVFVFEDEVAIDYEPGAEWNPEALEALLGLLCDIRRSAPASVITYERHATEQWRRAFATAVAQYCDRAPAG